MLIVTNMYVYTVPLIPHMYICTIYVHVFIKVACIRYVCTYITTCRT